MKKKIAWITDSTCSLSKEEIENLGVFVIPSTILFEETSYRDGLDITNEEFYEKLSTSSKIPTTSQPSVGETALFFESLKAEYEMGIAIHVSSKLSGTINSSVTAAEMADFPLIAIDSKTVADGMVQIIKAGMNLEKQGSDVKEIHSLLLELSDSNNFYALVGSLEQLHKGGRLSNAGFLIGNLLQVKPILTLDDGALIPFDKVRTFKKAEKRMLELAKEAIEKHNLSTVSIVHSASPEKASDWKEQLQSTYPQLDVVIGNLSPAIGVHAGSGTVGILWFAKNRT